MGRQCADGSPSRPKTSCVVPQLVQTNVLMFCTMPRIGTLTFLKRSTPRTASRRARSCGVETITAPIYSQYIADEKSMNGVVSTIQLNALCNRKLHISCPRWQVHYQEIQLRPGDFEEKLVHGFLNHQASPRNRAVLGDERAHRHGFNAVRRERD